MHGWDLILRLFVECCKDYGITVTEKMIDDLRRLYEEATRGR